MPDQYLAADFYPDQRHCSGEVAPTRCWVPPQLEKTLATVGEHTARLWAVEIAGLGIPADEAETRAELLGCLRVASRYARGQVSLDDLHAAWQRARDLSDPEGTTARLRWTYAARAVKAALFDPRRSDRCSGYRCGRFAHQAKESPDWLAVAMVSTWSAEATWWSWADTVQATAARWCRQKSLPWLGGDSAGSQVTEFAILQAEHARFRADLPADHLRRLQRRCGDDD